MFRKLTLATLLLSSASLSPNGLLAAPSESTAIETRAGLQAGWYAEVQWKVGGRFYLYGPYTEYDANEAAKNARNKGANQAYAIYKSG